MMNGLSCLFTPLCSSGTETRHSSPVDTVFTSGVLRWWCSVAWLCQTLCSPMDCGPPGSPVHGIFQTRILEWVAMPSSRGIFLTQGSNPCLLHVLQWQVDSLPLSHLGSHRGLYHFVKWRPFPKWQSTFIKVSKTKNPTYFFFSAKPLKTNSDKLCFMFG